jgi:hypothetical protein
MAKQVQNATPAIEDLDELEIDEMEQELTEATSKKDPKGEKKGKATREAKIGPTQIGAAALAEQLGTTGRELRMFLRKHFRDMSTDKGKTYVWERGSKEVQEIIDAYKAAKAAPKTKKEKALLEAAAPAAPVETVEPIDLDDLDLEEDN